MGLQSLRPRLASYSSVAIAVALASVVGVGSARAGSVAQLSPELLDLTDRAVIAAALDDELAVDAPQAVEVALAHAQTALHLAAPTRPLLVLPVEDGAGTLIAWQVLVSGATYAGREGYAALSALADSSAPKAADAATRFDRVYAATRGDVAWIEIAAHRFRHPVRWAQAGLPRWLIEHDALDALGVAPQALVTWPGVDEVVRATDSLGRPLFWTPRLGRAVSDKELDARFDAVTTFERWAANLQARYDEPTARLAFIDRLWHARLMTLTPTFVLGSTEATVTSAIFPWTQASACECCVCWETAMSTILSYWDDVLFGGAGPWDQLMSQGDRFDTPSFKQLSGRIYSASGLACDAGGSSYYWNDDVIQSTTAVVNTQLGYDFSFDYDGLIWFGSDIEDEINVGKPVYYGFSDTASAQPETWQVTTGHAITIVGVESTTELLYVYGNWDPVLSQKGFDDADDARDIDVTPGGTDCAPASWDPPATRCGVGACAATGEQRCVDGYFDDTCAPRAPLAAADTTCNGVDDDCDGTTDEDYLPVTTSCGVGACRRTGHTTCTGGHAVDLCAPGEPAANDATCNGVDDDCDGQIDEDCHPVQPVSSTPDDAQAGPGEPTATVGSCSAAPQSLTTLVGLFLVALARRRRAV